MSRRVALLRGINVGKAKRVAMAELRALVEGLGYAEVSTLLNSGNVVFTVPPREEHACGARIEAALRERLGVVSRVTTIGVAELAAMIDENPLGSVATDPAKLLLTVLSGPHDGERVRPLLERTWLPEALALGTRVVYVWCPNNIHESPLALAVGRALGEAGTARNLTTMRKLLAFG